MPPLKDLLETAGVKLVTTLALAGAALALGLQASSFRTEAVAEVKRDAAETYLRQDLYAADRATLDEKLARMGDAVLAVKGDVGDVNQDVGQLRSELGELRVSNAGLKDDMRRVEDLVRELLAKGR